MWSRYMALLLASTLAMACASSDTRPDVGAPGPGGGFDGGSRIPPVDAGRDGGPDAGVVRPDGGPWASLGALPPECEVYVTADPAEIALSFDRGPCPELAEGCERWTPSYPAAPYALHALDAAWDPTSETWRLAFERDVEEWRELFVIDQDGRARFTVRGRFYDDRCYPAFAALHPDAFALLLRGRGDERAWLARGVFGEGGAGDLASLRVDEVAHEDLRDLEAVSLLATNAAHTVFYIDGHDAAGRSVRRHVDLAFPSVLDSIAWPSVFVALVDDAVFFSRGSRLVAYPHLEPIVPIVEGEPSSTFTTDGRRLAWIGRVSLSPDTRWALWTSPYAERPEQLAPSRVVEHTELRTIGVLRLGAGYVVGVPPVALHGRGNATLRVWRLADGAYASVTFSERIDPPWFVGPRLVVPRASDGEDGSLMLIDLDALEFVAP